MSFLVMAKTVLKSLFRAPATVRYPFAPRTIRPGARGSVVITVADCIFCGMCQRKCPTAALAADRKEKTWQINRMRCITCGYCVEVCPKKCLAMSGQYSPPARTQEKETYRHA